MCRKTYRKIAWGISLAVILIVTATAANADIAIGDVRYNPDLGLANPPNVPFTLGAVNVVTAYTIPVASTTFALGGGYIGTVTSSVYMNAAGELAFDYQISITAVPVPPLATPGRSATIGGDWMPYKVYDVGAAGNGASTMGTWGDGDPAILGRLTAAGYGSPAVMWTTPLLAGGTYLNAGDSSSNFWFTTDAKSYTTSTFGMLDGGRTGSSFAFIPIPAPGAVLLGAMGLAMTAWVKRRNR